MLLKPTFGMGLEIRRRGTGKKGKYRKDKNLEQEGKRTQDKEKRETNLK